MRSIEKLKNILKYSTFAEITSSSNFIFATDAKNSGCCRSFCNKPALENNKKTQQKTEEKPTEPQKEDNSKILKECKDLLAEIKDLEPTYNKITIKDNDTVANLTALKKELQDKLNELNKKPKKDPNPGVGPVGKKDPKLEENPEEKPVEDSGEGSKEKKVQIIKTNQEQDQKQDQKQAIITKKLKKDNQNANVEDENEIIITEPNGNGNTIEQSISSSTQGKVGNSSFGTTNNGNLDYKVGSISSFPTTTTQTNAVESMSSSQKLQQKLQNNVNVSSTGGSTSYDTTTTIQEFISVNKTGGNNITTTQNNVNVISTEGTPSSFQETTTQTNAVESISSSQNLQLQGNNGNLSTTGESNSPVQKTTTQLINEEKITVSDTIF
jgi:hypothetical protein